MFVRAGVAPESPERRYQDAVKPSMGAWLQRRPPCTRIAESLRPRPHMTREEPVIPDVRRTVDFPSIVCWPICGRMRPKPRAQLRVSVARVIARIMGWTQSRQAEMEPITSAGQAGMKPSKNVPQTEAQHASEGPGRADQVELGQMDSAAFKAGG